MLRAIWRKFSIAPNMRSGSPSVRAKIRAMWRFACRRTLSRLPYGKDTKPIDEFSYEEHVDGTDHSKYLWMNAAYSLGTRMTNAFAMYGMCVAMRGVEGGGLVEGLADPHLLDRRRRHGPEVPDGNCHHRSPGKGAGRPGLRSPGALQGHRLCRVLRRAIGAKGKMYDTDAANANARLSTQLPYMMAVSRFAHYLKAMMRDKIGSFMSRKEAEAFLNRWITQLCDSR